MATDTDLIAQADAAIDRVVNAPQGIVDPMYVARAASLVPALRDALAAALAERDAETLRAELAECHGEALEAERDRLRVALEQIAETPARRFQRKIARAALTGEAQP